MTDILSKNRYLEFTYALIAFVFFSLYFWTLFKFSLLATIVFLVVLLAVFYGTMKILQRVNFEKINKFVARHLFSPIKLLILGISVNIIYFSTALAIAATQDSSLWPGFGFSIARSCGNIVALLAVYTWLTFFSYNIGSFIFGRLSFFKSLHQSIGFFVKLGIGFYSIILYYFLISLLHILFAGSIAFFLFSVFLFWQKRREIYHILVARPLLTSLKLKQGIEPYVFPMLSVVLIFSIFVMNHVRPESMYIDDILSYATVPLTYLRNNGIVDFPYYHLNETPFINTYLLMPLLQIFSKATSLLNLYFFMLSAALTCCCIFLSYGKQRIDFFVYALIALLTFNVHSFMFPSVRPDGLFLFFTLLFFTLLTTAHDKSPFVFGISGFFLGAAIATKYNAILMIPAVFFIIAAQRWTIKKIALQAAVVVMFAVIGFAPWGLYNTVHYHNPLHPLSPSAYQFLYPGVTSSQQATTKAFTTEWQRYNGLNFGDFSLWPRQIISLSLLNVGFLTNHLGPIVLLIFFALWIKKTNRRSATLLATVFLGYLFWKLSNVNQLHYLYFLAPIIAILFGWYMSQFETKFIPRALTLFLVLSFVTFYNAAGLSNAVYYLSMPKKEVSDSLSQNMQHTNAALINKLTTMDSHYVLLPLGDMMYGPDIVDIQNHIYENANLDVWAEITATADTVDQARARMRARGITHIYVDSASFLMKEFDPIKFPQLYKAHQVLKDLITSAPVVLQNRSSTIYQVL